MLNSTIVIALMGNKLPKEADFPAGTEFYIFEWDVPLSKEPSKDGKSASYFNWYGGTKKPYPESRLKIDNNWPANSFKEWSALIKSSL